MGGIIKIIIFSLMLAILIYPGLTKLYLYNQANSFEDLVMAPLGFLGGNQTILSNDDKFSRYGTNYKSLDLLPNRDLFLGIKPEFKFHEKWVNLSEERERVFAERLNQLKDSGNKISNKAYSIIVFGPYTDELDLYYLLNASKIFEGQSDYCGLYLPSAEHRCETCRFLIRAFLKEREACNKVAPLLVEYYNRIYPEICEADEKFTNLYLKTALVDIDQYGTVIKRDCRSGRRFFINYNNKKFRLDDFLNIIYLSLAIFVLLIISNFRNLFKGNHN